jgi:DNA-binding transcriptional ArsR family regulator
LIPKVPDAATKKLILSLLRKHESLSQTQLCRLVGIGSSTASTIVSRLRDKGLVLENRGLSDRRGPKPVILRLNPDRFTVIGIEINPSYVTVGLFDFIGKMTDKIQISSGPITLPNTFCRWYAIACRLC